MTALQNLWDFFPESLATVCIQGVCVKVEKFPEVGSPSAMRTIFTVVETRIGLRSCFERNVEGQRGSTAALPIEYAQTHS